MLVGREREREQLERTLESARAGASATLALVGEAGIGKTVLLDHAAERAAGMRVLRARGIESEAQIPFASLLELLRPALVMVDRIPEPQAVALEGALALRRGPSQQRFAVGAATLSLLAAYAEEGPVAVLVDDAHWLDGSSAQALLFAFRRLVADPIAVLIAVRDGDPSLLDGADLPTLRLGGLSRGEAVALLGGLSPVAAERLHGATAGNPLALIELAGDARDVALAPEGAPVLVSARISDAFLRRARRTRRVRSSGTRAGGDERERRSADARAGGGSARSRSGHARGRGGRRPRDAEAGVGRVPPPARPVGGLRRGPDRRAARGPPGARRRAARSRRRSPRVAPGRSGGRHRRRGFGGARTGRRPQPRSKLVRDGDGRVRTGGEARARRRAASSSAARSGRSRVECRAGRPRRRAARGSPRVDDRSGHGRRDRPPLGPHHDPPRSGDARVRDADDGGGARRSRARRRDARRGGACAPSPRATRPGCCRRPKGPMPS